MGISSDSRASKGNDRLNQDGKATYKILPLLVEDIPPFVLFAFGEVAGTSMVRIGPIT